MMHRAHPSTHPSRTRTVAFDLVNDAQRIGCAWARIQMSEGGFEVSCRFEIRTNVAGFRKQRRQSFYAFTNAGVLKNAHIKDHLGNEVSFETHEGRLIRNGITDQDTPILDFVLESNQVALTALLVDCGMIHDTGEHTALLPESGETTPYIINRTVSGWSDNYGTHFLSRTGDQIDTVNVDGTDLVFERSDRRFPRWSLDKVKPKPTYIPPNDIRLEDIPPSTPSAKRARYGASFARPIEDTQCLAVALFIGGTGVYDRHGFTPSLDLGYHQLLDGLAREGIASLRYERLNPAANSIAEAERELGFDTLCEQAVTWFDYMCEHPDFRDTPKLLIGHSLGGFVVMQVASSRQADTIVLLNTPGRSFRQVTEDQFDWLLRASEKSPDARVESDKLRDDFITSLEDDGADVPPKKDGRIQAMARKRQLYRDILDLDPTDLLTAALTCPTIIVQGTADVQVSEEDARILDNVATKVQRPHKLISAKDLDHLLMRNRHHGLKALEAYADKRRRVPKAFIRRMARTIRKAIG